MYFNYFGLSEASFSITPDPRYLFLSAQHREGLAHLLYGAGENGGFVLLTGEIGTGKTTLCRAFLEQTPAQVDVALVLNPAMTAIELMQAICQEFGLATSEHTASLKVLVDRLNGYLLAAHAGGRHPVLVIDEAQNLRPGVLEQVRLLTNLETSKHKLLQIFLIGQPELRTLLASPALRQLNQRITARFHLGSLSARETRAYIDHRVAVAGVERPLFSAAALREVHRRSRGVPRLINLICDRALLGAAVSRRLQVTPAIVRRAAREVLGDQRPRRQSHRQSRLALAASLILALGLGGWLGASGVLEQTWRRVDRARLVWTHLRAEEAPERLAEGDAKQEVLQPASETDVSLASAPESAPDSDSDRAVSAPVPSQTPDEAIPRIALARIRPLPPKADLEALSELLLEERESLAALLPAWGHAPEAAADCDALGALGLACERSTERWSDLRLFDRPAVLHLSIDGRERYALIAGLDDEYAVLQRGQMQRRLPIATLDERWSGEVLMLWRPPPTGTRLIGPSTSGAAVPWLRERLAALPDLSVTDLDSPRYDADLQSAVRDFQRDHGLRVDGIAGPRTLILLNNALSDTEVPRLSQAQQP